MTHKRIFRTTLAGLLVVVAIGAAWMAGAQTAEANGAKINTGALQPAAAETLPVLPQGALAWDCPGCPPG